MNTSAADSHARNRQRRINAVSLVVASKNRRRALPGRSATTHLRLASPWHLFRHSACRGSETNESILVQKVVRPALLRYKWRFMNMRPSIVLGCVSVICAMTTVLVAEPPRDFTVKSPTHGTSFFAGRCQRQNRRSALSAEDRMSILPATHQELRSTGTQPQRYRPRISETGC